MEHDRNATETKRGSNANRVKTTSDPAERIEQLLLIGGLGATSIRAQLIEEGIATRVSLATVEREIEAIYGRWHATAVTGVTDAALRHLPATATSTSAPWLWPTVPSRQG